MAASVESSACSFKRAQRHRQYQPSLMRYICGSRQAVYIPPSRGEYASSYRTPSANSTGLCSYCVQRIRSSEAYSP